MSDRAKDSFSSHPNVGYSDFSDELLAALPGLPEKEARCAQYMRLNVASIAYETGRTLAEKAGVSEVTVGRLLRRLGYDGLKGLKKVLQTHAFEQRVAVSDAPGEGDALPPALAERLKLEQSAVAAVYRQASSPIWAEMLATLRRADAVFVTGFQSVRGLAEDTARRLSLARPHVRFLAAHDDMLGEWLHAPAREARECLLLIDVVPYAREAKRLVEIAKEQGRAVVIISDEYCHWGDGLADYVVYAPSRSNLFLESTTGLCAALNLLINGVAEGAPEAVQERLDAWKTLSRKIEIF